MKLGAFEEKSDDELFEMICHAEEYADEDIQKAQEVIAKRANSDCGENGKKEASKSNDMVNELLKLSLNSKKDISDMSNSEKEVVQNPETALVDRISECANYLKTIKNCAIFFVVLTIVSLVVSFVAGANILTTLDKLF